LAWSVGFNPLTLLFQRIKAKIKAFLNGLESSSVNSGTLVENSTLAPGYEWVPDWPSILGEDWLLWKEFVVSQSRIEGRPKVLIATMVGGNQLLVPFEALMGIALTLRGAEVHYVLCDKSLLACQNCWATDEQSQSDFIEKGPSSCDWCFDVGQKSLSELGLTVHKYSQWTREEDFSFAQEVVKDLSLQEMLDCTTDGICHEEILKSAVLRYFGRSDFENEKNIVPVARRYLKSSIVTNRVLARLFEQFKFEHTVSNQGIYVPQANVVAAARKFNSHLIVWDPGYRRNCVNFCHDGYHATALIDEPNHLWENLPWNDAMEQRITEYLDGRKSSKYDWIKVLTEGEDTSPESILQQLKVDPNKPILGLLTNVLWDAQLCYGSNAFGSQLEWIYHTIEYFKKRDDLQLLIRVHPSELDGWIKSRQSVMEELQNRYEQLPPNVFVIPAGSKINTYQAMKNADAITIFGTTAGLEMLCMRIPVIVAGEAWIRSKKISHVVSCPEDFDQVLDQLPFRYKLSDEQYKRALKYAYHLYFRKMIELNCLESLPTDGFIYRVKKCSLSELKDGADLGLDTVCNGILTRSQFIYPMERQDLKGNTIAIR